MMVVSSEVRECTDCSLERRIRGDPRLTKAAPQGHSFRIQLQVSPVIVDGKDRRLSPLVGVDEVDYPGGWIGHLGAVKGYPGDQTIDDHHVNIRIPIRCIQKIAQAVAIYESFPQIERIASDAPCWRYYGPNYRHTFR